MTTKEPVVECVPNFSEGRDAKRVEAILAAMRMAGVHLLDLRDIEPLALGRQIDGLASGHAESAAGFGQQFDQLQADRRRRRQRRI